MLGDGGIWIDTVFLLVTIFPSFTKFYGAMLSLY